MDNLHYRGDCTDIDREQIFGPDQYGAGYVAVAARYSASTDTTTVAFRPLPPDELQERVAARNVRVAERHRIHRLFNGGKQ